MAIERQGKRVWSWEPQIWCLSQLLLSSVPRGDTCSPVVSTAFSICKTGIKPVSPGPGTPSAGPRMTWTRGTSCTEMVMNASREPFWAGSVVAQEAYPVTSQVRCTGGQSLPHTSPHSAWSFTDAPSIQMDDKGGKSISAEIISVRMQRPSAERTSCYEAFISRQLNYNTKGKPSGNECLPQEKMQWKQEFVCPLPWGGGVGLTVSVSEDLQLKVRRHMFSMETEISLTPIGQHCSLSGGGVPDISVQLGMTEGCQYFYTNSVQLKVHSLSCVWLF